MLFTVIAEAEGKKYGILIEDTSYENDEDAAVEEDVSEISGEES